MESRGPTGAAVQGPTLARDTVRRRLGALLDRPVPPAPVECSVSWHGPATLEVGELGGEATVQARSGLMEVHGWDAGGPRRLGLEVASVAAGVLGSAGVLAALVGGCRDRRIDRVETSVLQGGLWLVAHHLAAAAAAGEPLASPPGPDPGPPFRSADGRWFEIEVFDAEGWKAFWVALGAGDCALGPAWTAFRARYYRGRCTLPVGLHDAAACHPIEHLGAVARACGVSLVPLRSYAEVVAAPGWSERRLVPLDRPVDPADHARPVHHDAARTLDSRLPLAGLRVVEATNRMQGPLAGLLLQMLGADVVRVEPPGGDVGRMVPPLCGDVGCFFACYNRGKSPAEVDLATAPGRDALRELVAGADVFLHNWRPGKAEAWGLDRDTLTRADRRLVYAEATGWGSVEAGKTNKGMIGTDFLVQAYAGFGEGLNPVGEEPRTSRVLLADCLGALVTAEAILAALYRRVTATGSRIAVTSSLLDGAMAAQAHVLAALTGNSPDGERQDGRALWGPLDRPIPTAGGLLVLTVDRDGDAYRRRLDTTLGLPAGGCSGHDADEARARRLLEATAPEWETLLAGAGIPAAAVATDLAAVSADRRLKELFEPLGGGCLAPASPWVLE